LWGGGECGGYDEDVWFLGVLKRCLDLRTWMLLVLVLVRVFVLQRRTTGWISSEQSVSCFPLANSFSSVLLHDLILCGIIRFLLFLLYLFFPAFAGSCIASRYHLLLQKLYLFFFSFTYLLPIYVLCSIVRNSTRHSVGFIYYILSYHTILAWASLGDKVYGEAVRSVDVRARN
jgi:hypothetical protein